MLARLWSRLWNAVGTEPAARRRVTRASCAPAVEVLEAKALLRISFQFDYSLDTNNFFNTPSKRNLMEIAGKFLAENINDTLNSIVPGGGNTWTPNISHPSTGNTFNLPGSTQIPANVIRVFPGGRDLPSGNLAVGGFGGFSASGTQGWIDNVRARGEPGAVNPGTATDIAPAVGSVSFDTVGVNWNFAVTTANLDNSRQDFLSVAIHELGHVLGITNGQQSWSRFIVGNAFTGPNSTAEFGGAVPLNGDLSHWADGTTNDGLETAMDPTIFSGARKLFSDLDFAALRDIGWEVRYIEDTIYQARQRLTDRPGTPTDSHNLGAGIDKPNDVDLWRVHVQAGHSLRAVVGARAGMPTIDSYVRLFDMNGTQLAFGNQGGVGQNDVATFTVPRTDYYFVGVSSAVNSAYNPRKANSGVNGPTGGYYLQIRIFDTLPGLSAADAVSSAPRAAATSTAPLVDQSAFAAPATKSATQYVAAPAAEAVANAPLARSATSSVPAKLVSRAVGTRPFEDFEAWQTRL